MTAIQDRPIRIVFFAGRYLQPLEARFAALLEEHPEIDLVLGVCEAEGAGMRFRIRDLWHRRGWLAPAVLAMDVAAALGRWLRHPRDMLQARRSLAGVQSKFITVPDVHAPGVLSRIQAAAPDLGVIYGAPILRPEIFEIPVLGTLGIHHGRVPQYRGKKTTFWEIYNGERGAGVTIQRVNRGIDTGEIVRQGEVAIGRKGYGRVWREVQQLGFELYLAAILDFKHGRATLTAQDAFARGPLYRQPAPGDLLRYMQRRWLGRSSPVGPS